MPKVMSTNKAYFLRKSRRYLSVRLNTNTYTTFNLRATRFSQVLVRVPLDSGGNNAEAS
jgi:hypothetical protein